MQRGVGDTSWKWAATMLGVLAFVAAVVVASTGWFPSGWTGVLGNVVAGLVLIVGTGWYFARRDRDRVN